LKLLLIACLWCMLCSAVLADSSGPRLAAYYDLNLAICDGRVYEWEDRDQPREVMQGVRQVGVGRNRRYALTDEGRLLTWSEEGETTTELMRDVSSFHAGRSGLLVIHDDGTLWSQPVQGLWGFGERLTDSPTRVAAGVRSAAVGDSANYYVTEQGDLFVHGKAFRGQYGDGTLRETDGYTRTAGDVVQVVAHTGHALILKRDGTVWGTGGNIYGPLGHHGYGDKAIVWGRIVDDATAIATGSSHSLAIKRDGSLWIWGRNEGLDPRRVMDEVLAVAASNKHSIAIGQRQLWQWRTGDAPEAVMPCT
jgi:alpha-tubulin suppressor-like RCC1 family protein